MAERIIYAQDANSPVLGNPGIPPLTEENSYVFILLPPSLHTEPV